MNEVQNEYTLVGYRRLRFPDAEGNMIEGTQVMVIDSKEDTEDSISYPMKYWFPGLKTFADLKKQNMLSVKMSRLHLKSAE